VHGKTYDEFIADDKTVWATERALEIIGEATKRLPEEVKALDAEVFRGSEWPACATSFRTSTIASGWRVSGRQSRQSCLRWLHILRS